MPRPLRPHPSKNSPFQSDYRHLTPIPAQNPIFMAFLPIFPTMIPPNPNQTPILAPFSISDYVSQPF